MKKRIFLKAKALRAEEYKRLARIIKLRFGYDLNSKRTIFKALEYGCKKIDPNFSCEQAEIPYEGGYDPETHTVYITMQTLDDAWSGDVNALFTIVHEISHWALITVFGIKPEYIVFELPLVLSATTDAELYADTFSCYLMMPQVMICGGKKKCSFFRKILKTDKNSGILTLSLVILKNRRYYSAIGYTAPPYWVKKTA